MSEELPEGAPNTGPVDSLPPLPPNSGERPIWSVVIVAAIGLMIVAVAGLGYYYFWDDPTLVPVTGKITMNGKPLTSGHVMAKRVRDRTLSLSGLDADGRFSLATNGTDGALTGTHKLVVHAMTRQMPPSPLVPAKYTDESTTPLSIDVRKGADNHFEFDIEMP